MAERTEDRPGSPGLAAAHSRVLQHADKLFESLDDLAGLGGLKALRASLRPASVERTVKVLESVRGALDEVLGPGKKG